MRLTKKQTNILIYIGCIFIGILSLIGASLFVVGVGIISDKYPKYIAGGVLIILLLWVLLTITQSLYNKFKRN